MCIYKFIICMLLTIYFSFKPIFYDIYFLKKNVESSLRDLTLIPKNKRFHQFRNF
jgi:hypothetical protein